MEIRPFGNDHIKNYQSLRELYVTDLADSAIKILYCLVHRRISCDFLLA